MPTPFTHLVIAERLRHDPALETAVAGASALLAAHLPAFWLGSIAADAQTIAALMREDTHFYSYDLPMPDHPARVMLDRHPELMRPHDADHRAFVAGYVQHLAVDEYWTLDMTRPHFAQREWASRPQRFLSLHLLLITMDERDYARLPAGIAGELSAAQPNAWLPFMSDETLCAWRETIARQIPPNGESETLKVIAPRVMRQPAEMRQLLDSQAVMDRDVWAHIPPELLATVEGSAYTAARDQLIAYLRASA
jgi:hypothetical protein